MGTLEYKILTKRQVARDLLVYAMKQIPVYLPIVKELKFEITVCDLALFELRSLHYKRVGSK